MKKKNIGFIVFGIAGGELISILALLFIFPWLYERMGVPQTPVIDRMLVTISIVSFFITIIVGVILLIKFRHEE